VEERSAHFQPYKSLIQKGRAKFCVSAVEDKSAVFHQGQETLRVPMTLYAENRSRVLRTLATKLPDSVRRGTSFVFLQGGVADHRHATDIEPVFRQESFFHHVFGVTEEGCYGAMHIATGTSMLFVPRLPEEYAIWMGQIRSLSYFKEKYGVDEVHYVNEMCTVLRARNASTLLVLDGENTDSGRSVTQPTFAGIESFKVETTLLHQAMTAVRAIKNKLELEVMQYVNTISSQAHVEVMRACKPGMMEYQLESCFQHSVYSKGGCRHVAYTSICASGPNSAVLHYGHAGAPNDKQLMDGEMVLLDMGAEYSCYASDITCTYPVNGKFTKDQRVVYEGVLAAHKEVIKSMRPGVGWVDMHLLAEKHILMALHAGGFLTGDVDAMMDKRLGAVFMPHGLGHLLGIDTHDVGGYVKGGHPRINLPGINRLRTTRALEDGMVITVEPGCYFNNYLLDQAKGDPNLTEFFNWDMVDQCRSFGGVRIEDNVVVTSDGAYSLTNVPREVDDVEAVMAGADWPRK